VSRANKGRSPVHARRAVVALGSNLGDSIATLKAACARLAELKNSADFRVSPLYRSEAMGATVAQPDYLNAVASFDTIEPTLALWKAIETIEQALGRTRTQERNAARTIDLDLLLVGDEVLAAPTLTLPHPRMTERAFVLRPLVDIEPNIEIPGLDHAAAFLDRVATQRIERVAECVLWK
jgi:2-amino-4-hydroxy-6-hydroxymethyldihydropteridine diphosphokinase